MKRFVISFLFLIYTAPFTVLAESDTANPEQQLSYALGVETAKSFQQHDINIDTKQFIEGMTDVFNKVELKMSDKEIASALMQLQKEQSANYSAKMTKLAEDNQAASSAYLAENAKKSDVKTLDGGVQYQIVKQGDGPTPSLNDTVTVDYEGKLIDGTVFDSSFARQETAKFPVSGVIKGWQQALTQMPVGSVWIITIPADLAYGKTGTPDGSIGPNQALIFKVDLIKIDSDQNN